MKFTPVNLAPVLQEDVPGPITVASLASDGLMSRHLRLHGEHVAPGDVIIALDGKAVVSGVLMCICSKALQLVRRGTL